MSDLKRNNNEIRGQENNPSTIKDVAQAAGVSTSTVSRALSGKIPVLPETAARIHKAAADLRYSPSVLARGLKDGSSRTIGLIIPDISNPVFPAVALGAESEALLQGYQVFLANSHEDPELENKLVDLMIRRKVEGLLIASVWRGKHEPDWLNLAIPVVQLVRKVTESIPSIETDQRQIGKLAADHLLQKNRKCPLILTGDLTLPLYKQRIDGFIDAYRAAGIGIPERAIIDGNGIEFTDLAAGFINLNDYDAVFASCDLQALSVIRYLMSRRVEIPEKMAVVGMDNTRIYHLCTPAITAIRQPLQDIGRQALIRVLELIQDRNKGEIKITPPLSCELYIGETT